MLYGSVSECVLIIRNLWSATFLFKFLIHSIHSIWVFILAFKRRNSSNPLYFAYIISVSQPCLILLEIYRLCELSIKCWNIGNIIFFLLSIIWGIRTLHDPPDTLHIYPVLLTQWLVTFSTNVMRIIIRIAKSAFKANKVFMITTNLQ